MAVRLEALVKNQAQAFLLTKVLVENVRAQLRLYPLTLPLDCLAAPTQCWKHQVEKAG
jgi:hypothetical protein